MDSPPLTSAAWCIPLRGEPAAGRQHRTAGGLPLAGRVSTLPTLAVSQSGNYAVTVSANGCQEARAIVTGQPTACVLLTGYQHLLRAILDFDFTTD